MHRCSTDDLDVVRLLLENSPSRLANGCECVYLNVIEGFTVCDTFSQPVGAGYELSI